MAKTIFLFFLLVFVSCNQHFTKKRSSKTRETESLFTEIKPFWFKTLNRFQLLSKEGKPSVHLFYDVLPRINFEKGTLNYVVSTPEDSTYGYELHLSSGKLYLDKKFCSHPSRSTQFRGSVNRPPFTIGFIPRILNVQNEAQKVIIFGKSPKESREFSDSHYFRGRIIGSFIEYSCLEGECRNPKDWSSELVLVLIHDKSDRFLDVESLPQAMKNKSFQSLWQRSVAFLESGIGSNLLTSDLKSFRVGRPLSKKQTLAYFKKNLNYLSNKQLVETRKSCYKLYDHIYKNLTTYNTPKMLSLKFSNTKRNNASKSLKYEFDFFKKFISSIENYRKEFYICQKFVYPSSVNDNQQRFNFFVFYNAYNLLLELGYYYNCKLESWVKMPINFNQNGGTQAIFKGCLEKHIHKGLRSSTFYLSHLRGLRKNSYRFLENDNFKFGSHQKIYSWVPFDNKYLSCNKNSENQFFRDNLYKEKINFKWRVELLFPKVK